MKLAIVTTLLVMASGVAVAVCGERSAKAAERFDAKVLGAWPDHRPLPGRNRDSDIVFEELVIRAQPPRRAQKAGPADPLRRLPNGVAR